MIPVVFINCKKVPYVDLIIKGKKKYETRNRNTLRSLVGRRVLIAETGRGYPKIRCSAIIGAPIISDSKETWDTLKPITCVPDNSDHDWKDNTKRKWLYLLRDVREVIGLHWKEGKRHGITWMEYEPAPYRTIWDGDHFIDGQDHDSLEAAIADAEDTLVEWAAESMSTWKFGEDIMTPAPTEEQIEDWDYMIYNCGAHVVAFDEKTGEYGDYLDDAVWPRSQEDLDNLGWMLWEDYVKKFGQKDKEE